MRERGEAFLGGEKETACNERMIRRGMACDMGEGEIALL